MTTDFILVPPPKPRYGSPCNHCGLCCQLELCYAAEMSGFTTTPCPALQKTADGQMCGLVLAESGLPSHQRMVTIGLGIGEGCSMPDKETTDEEIAAFDIRAMARVEKM